MEIAEDPLRASRWALRTASISLQAMKDAGSFEDFAHAWQTFLERLEKVWVKVERECQHLRNTFEPWQGNFKSLRKQDPLLSFLHQARHADQHSIQPTAANAIGGFQIKIPPNGQVELRLDRAAGKIELRGAILEPVLLSPRPILLPIRNQGVLFNPPCRHLGIELEENGPINVAEKGLLFYTNFLKQVEDKFFRVA